MIAGVCGGLAKYFDLDPVLVRLAFAVFTLAGGAGPLAYLVLWIIMPLETHDGWEEKEQEWTD
jgi:phage shock protein PspC (stress-responsive transcriptional regulator)